MTPPSSINPPISPLLSAVTWLEVAVLVVAGGGLLIAYPLVVGIWSWSLAPFNLRFLGALYTAALLSAFFQSWFGKWAPARTVTTMIFVFTLVVTACSFLHWERFDPARVEVWVWFALYIGVCLNAGAHLWWYRNVPAAGALSLLRSATRIDWFTLGITQLAWGLLPIVALVIVDIQMRRVDWLAWPLWLWIGLFVMTAAMGVWMLRMAASESVP